MSTRSPLPGAGVHRSLAVPLPCFLRNVVGVNPTAGRIFRLSSSQPHFPKLLFFFCSSGSWQRTCKQSLGPRFRISGPVRTVKSVPSPLSPLDRISSSTSPAWLAGAGGTESPRHCGFNNGLSPVSDPGPRAALPPAVLQLCSLLTPGLTASAAHSGSSQSWASGSWTSRTGALHGCFCGGLVGAPGRETPAPSCPVAGAHGPPLHPPWEGEVRAHSSPGGQGLSRCVGTSVPPDPSTPFPRTPQDTLLYTLPPGPRGRKCGRTESHSLSFPSLPAGFQICWQAGPSPGELSGLALRVSSATCPEPHLLSGIPSLPPSAPA